MMPRTPTLTLALLALAGGMAPRALAAQPPTPPPARDTLRLSLGDALDRASRENEDVGRARSQVRSSRAQIAQTRSGLFPQLNLQLSYQRTLRSPVSLGGFSLPDSLRFQPDTLASLVQRVRYLEQRVPAATLQTLGGLFSTFPLGQPNTYIGAVGISQKLFDWQAVVGLKAAHQVEAVQDLQLTESELDVSLQVVQAYYDAILAERLSEIADASLAQADTQLQHVQLQQRMGNKAELDVLQVQVDRDNLEPQRIQALNQRDQALLNLKRLIGVPMTAPVTLTDSLSPEQLHLLPASRLADLVASAVRRRPSVEAAERTVLIRELQTSAARAQLLPSLALQASFGRQALPISLVPTGSDFRDNWTVGLAVQLPIFDGGKTTSAIAQAREQVVQADLQLTQLRKAVTLDATQQRGELDRAAATIAARALTVQRAATAYDMAQLAFSKGVASTLQLQDSRLQLRQARANEVQALHDYYVALAKLLRAAGQQPTPQALAGAIDGSPR